MSAVSIIYKNGRPHEFVMGQNVKHNLTKERFMPVYSHESQMESVRCSILVCKTSAKVSFYNEDGSETSRIFRINKPNVPRYSGEVALTRLT